VQAHVSLNGEVNVSLPVSAFKETVFAGDTRAIAHFVKVDPAKDWGSEFILTVSTNGKPSNLVGGAVGSLTTTPASVAPLRRNGIMIQTNEAGTGEGSTPLLCPSCRHTNFEGMDYCDMCGSSLKDDDHYA
jgi:hypothetical protein